MFVFQLIIEEICRDVHHAEPDLKIILLRYFNPVGAHPSGYIGEDPRGIPNNLMPFVQQVAVGRRPALTVFGNDYNTVDGTGVSPNLSYEIFPRKEKIAWSLTQSYPVLCSLWFYTFMFFIYHTSCGMYIVDYFTCTISPHLLFWIPLIKFMLK